MPDPQGAGGLLETDLYDMPKGSEAKDVLSAGLDLWNEQLKLPAEERKYGKGKHNARWQTSSLPYTLRERHRRSPAQRSPASNCSSIRR